MVESGSVLEGVIVHGEPLVSVKVIAYNHGKYIRQCLDGILMQKVSFPYEVIVHDDASPDDTADIIREYEAKYPKIIKPIYQTVNQYSQGISFAKLLNSRLRGKYVAQCEGDDYWTDPEKLQIQVDFLEAHPEYIGTAHNVRIVDENGMPRNMEYGASKNNNGKFTYHDVELGRLSGQSASLVFRNIYMTLDPIIIDAHYKLPVVGDQKLNLLLCLNGDFYCFTSTMSDYRYVTTGTSYSAQTYGHFLGVESIQYLRYRVEFASKYYNVDFRCVGRVFAIFILGVINIVSKHNRLSIIEFMEIIPEMICDTKFLAYIIRQFIKNPMSALLDTLYILGVKNKK